MAGIINVGIKMGDFLKFLWIDVKKSRFRKKFELVNFGLDNAYQKKSKECDEKILYCFVCGNKGETTPLLHVVGYDWDYKCDICKETFNIKKKESIDFEKRRYN